MAGTATTVKVLHRPRGVVRCQVALTTDASGNTTATPIGTFFGRLVGFCYDGGLDASAVITIKDAKTGATVFSYTTGTEGTPTFVRPSTNVVDSAGTTITAATTANDVWRDIRVAGKLTVTVASGGNAETGTFALIIDEANIGNPAITTGA